MKRSDIKQLPEFFDRYIMLVQDLDIVEALEQHAKDFEQPQTKSALIKLADKKYAPGKWTVKEVIRHIIDNERIQAYRALRFARNDKTSLPGYDETLYSQTAETKHRSMEEILEEFSVVRKSTILLYKSFTNTMQQRDGICFNRNISVLSLGFVIAGHQIHHFNVLKERYFALL